MAFQFRIFGPAACEELYACALTGGATHLPIAEIVDDAQKEAQLKLGFVKYAPIGLLLEEMLKESQQTLKFEDVKFL